MMTRLLSEFNSFYILFPHFNPVHRNQRYIKEDITQFLYNAIGNKRHQIGALACIDVFGFYVDRQSGIVKSLGWVPFSE